jgi:N-methylhydantoinase A
MDFVHAYVTLLDRIDWPRLNDIYKEMAGQAVAELARAGVQKGDLRWIRQADMRYVNQGHEVVVPVPDGHLGPTDLETLRDSFREVYVKLFSRYERDVPVEVLNWRLIAVGPQPEIGLEETGTSLNGHGGRALKGSRRAYLPESRVYSDVQVYDRYALRPGDRFQGPAIVEERESTAVVGPGASCSVDRYLNLVIDLKGGAEE